MSLCGHTTILQIILTFCRKKQARRRQSTTKTSDDLREEKPNLKRSDGPKRKMAGPQPKFKVDLGMVGNSASRPIRPVSATLSATTKPSPKPPK